MLMFTAAHQSQVSPPGLDIEATRVEKLKHHRKDCEELFMTKIIYEDESWRSKWIIQIGYHASSNCITSIQWIMRIQLNHPNKIGWVIQMDHDDPNKLYK